METSWQNITRRLDIEQVSRDTTFDKTKAKGRGLAKIPYTFVIPSITFTPSAQGIANGLTSKGALIAQFNYTAPRAFRLIAPVFNPSGSSNTAIVLPAIRYRVGGTVYRYQIRSTAASTVSDEQLRRDFRTVADIYTNQLIKPNFSIEYYLVFSSINLSSTQLSTTITTNLLAIPTDADALSESFDEPVSVQRSTIHNAFPEPIPTSYVEASYWLNNT